MSLYLSLASFHFETVTKCTLFVSTGHFHILLLLRRTTPKLISRQDRIYLFFFYFHHTYRKPNRDEVLLTSLPVSLGILQKESFTTKGEEVISCLKYRNSDIDLLKRKPENVNILSLCLKAYQLSSKQQ